MKKCRKLLLKLFVYTNLKNIPYKFKTKKYNCKRSGKNIPKNQNILTVYYKN